MKSTRRIGLILTLVFLLPALFFSVYEMSSLNKDEEMIQNIYNKQLDAILFSINQYSDDILNTWTSKIEKGLRNTETTDSIPTGIYDLLMYNPSIMGILISDTAYQGSDQHFYATHRAFSGLKTPVSKAIENGHDLILQLESYKKSGFQKVAYLPVDWGKQINLQCLIFITGDEKWGYSVVTLVINPDMFIVQLVGPRLQVIAKDQFILSAFNKNISRPIYSTMLTDSSSVIAEASTKDFWLFPDYVLGIRTQGASIQDLINERTTNNLILLVALDIILIVAVVLVFRNVKREVQLAQNKADFVSNVSHEIRTPLALISMFAETLEMGRVTTSEKRQEYYGIISKETHRLSGIVNKILNFSQAEANKKIYSPTQLNPGEEIREILKTYEYHLSSKGFEYSLTEKSKELVFVDRGAFIEIIINLIDNAIKYSGDRKRIEIMTGSENGYGYVSIRDYGVGISKGDQRHIFDKFYRVPTGDLAKSTGTGLGLSLVKQLIDAQNGKIDVTSVPNEGSTFTVYFPFYTK